MARFAHWTPRYVADRLALRDFERRNPTAPWLTAAMIAILDGWLKPGDHGLEWGSGRSTAWLAQRVGRLTTVEDDIDWGARVRAMLAAQSIAHKVDLHLIAIDKASPATRAAPYVAVAAAIAEESLDFCLVDGDLRDLCAEAALPLLKPGGVLIIDNVERYIPRADKSTAPAARGPDDGFESPLWQTVWGAIGSWRCVWTSNGVTDTAFWVKPLGAGQ